MNSGWKVAMTGFLAVALALIAAGGADAKGGHGKRESIVAVENAMLDRLYEQTATFFVDIQSRQRTVRGRLSDRTRILDEDGEPLDPSGLSPGSLWNVELRYPQGGEGPAEILELQKTRDQLPQ